MYFWVKNMPPNFCPHSDIFAIYSRFSTFFHRHTPWKIGNDVIIRYFSTTELACFLTRRVYYMYACQFDEVSSCPINYCDLHKSTSTWQCYSCVYFIQYCNWPLYLHVYCFCVFLFLARYVPDVAKRSIWDQCKKKYILRTDWPTDDRPTFSFGPYWGNFK